MNRRDFLGLFAKTSAAGAAAATGLIALPETHKPIELLEPKKIITDLDAPIIFDYITEFKYIRDESVRFDHVLHSLEIFARPGITESMIEVTVELQDQNGQILHGSSNNASVLAAQGTAQLKAIFNIPELRNKVFTISRYEMVGSADNFLTVEMLGYQLNPNGTVI